jgi:hypothetical protein
MPANARSISIFVHGDPSGFRHSRHHSVGCSIMFLHLVVNPPVHHRLRKTLTVPRTIYGQKNYSRRKDWRGPVRKRSGILHEGCWPKRRTITGLRAGRGLVGRQTRTRRSPRHAWRVLRHRLPRSQRIRAQQQVSPAFAAGWATPGSAMREPGLDRHIARLPVIPFVAARLTGEPHRHPGRLHDLYVIPRS